MARRRGRGMRWMPSDCLAADRSVSDVNGALEAETAAAAAAAMDSDDDDGGVRRSRRLRLLPPPRFLGFEV